MGQAEYSQQFSGSKRRLVQKYDTYQYVPLLPSLRRLLCDKSVLEQVENCQHRIRNDGKIQDFCHGTLFSKHPVFSQDHQALQIIAYFDELEICNPLGSHTKRHKVGIVFYTLGNIAPIYRSQLRLINLAIVATVSIIEKHGLNKILEPFLSDLNILSTQGVSVHVSGTQKTYKGALLVFLADNLASNNLGGFKMSFSFAFRSCRSCLVTRDSYRKSFTCDDFELRTEIKHRKQLTMLSGPTAEHFSKTYGINEKSALLNVKHFPMFGGGLPHDAMHDILEGLAPLEIKLMLNYFITGNLFSLSYFNDRLINFNYGYSESDKPVPILSNVLYNPEKKIRASSSQMLVLVRIMPFLIGNKIQEGEDHWLCFVLLRKILDIVLCPNVSSNLCSSLKLLIKEHHTLFVRLYGANAMIPKMHFIIHYPDQIEAVGPMICTWTIRHEAKLNFFKQASKLLNFKNVALSLAYRHQRWFCYEMATSKLVHAPLEVGPPECGSGITVVNNETEYVKSGIINVFPQISQEAVVFRPKWVRRHGTLYNNNNVYLIIKSDGLDPVFGRLDELVVLGGDSVIFVLSLCKVLFFDDHYHSYAITVGSQRLFISEIIDHNVYHGHKMANGHTYITLKYHFL